MEVRTGERIVSAVEQAGRFRVRAETEGRQQEHEIEAVVAATGYRYVPANLGFVDPALRIAVRQLGGMPILNSNYESSVPGLHFVGAAAALCFGPAIRFVHGAKQSAVQCSTYFGTGGGKPRRVKSRNLIRAQGGQAA